MDNLPIENTPAESIPVENLSKGTKKNKILLVGALVVVVILLLGGFWAYRAFQVPSVGMQKVVSNGTSGNNNPGQGQQATVSQTVKDTSNVQIDKDLQTIDSGISNTDTDSTAIDQGLNDQETNLQ